MTSRGADGRLRRLLSLIPWVAANDGPTVEEVTSRFGITEAQLAGDLEQLYMCGLWPYTPDMLIEADIADGRVWIRYAEYFDRPLRLTPAEGLSLVAAGSAMLASPGVDPNGPLARGLSKLAGALGVEGDGAMEVELAPAEVETIDAMRVAAEQHRQVAVEYYAYGRDAQTERVIEPWEVFSQAGQWYVRAHCHQAHGERLFRIDRIRSARPLDDTASEPIRPGSGSVFQAQPDDPVVVIEVDHDARWVAEQYPTEDVREVRGGRLRITLKISEPAWLDRLLLRLGPRAKVIRGEADIATAAGRILARYPHR
ncbi:MAG: helix-turn-helix transcriptional regulator [Acidimicrobiales bacterium]